MFVESAQSNLTIHTCCRAMEGLRTFLESSTIHGLTYISTTKKCARLFWFLVVITGFVGASLLIKESFDSWSESPVKTTIKTLPISEIRFPKVTVCPPKNTFTDLNYDLMHNENMTLSEGMRDEMFKYALDALKEESFSQSKWAKFHEEDRFYNWYHGYTQIRRPYYFLDDSLSISIVTTATSGVVTTQQFGKEFKPKLVERKLSYKVNVYPPWIIRKNETVTLHFKVDRVSMTGLAKKSKDTVYGSGFDYIDADTTTAYTNFTPPSYNQMFQLMRDVSSEEVETQKLDLMPGFRLSWWYSGAKVTPDNTYKNEEVTKQFVR